jgi:hypothetical protein
MGVELLSLTEKRRGGLKKKVLMSHDGTMRVPRGEYGCEKRPRAKLNVKLTEVMKE